MLIYIKYWLNKANDKCHNTAKNVFCIKHTTAVHNIAICNK